MTVRQRLDDADVDVIGKRRVHYSIAGGIDCNQIAPPLPRETSRDIGFDVRCRIRREPRGADRHERGVAGSAGMRVPGGIHDGQVVIGIWREAAIFDERLLDRLHVAAGL